MFIKLKKKKKEIPLKLSLQLQYIQIEGFVFAFLVKKKVMSCCAAKHRVIMGNNPVLCGGWIRIMSFSCPDPHTSLSRLS